MAKPLGGGAISTGKKIHRQDVEGCEKKMILPQRRKARKVTGAARHPERKRGIYERFLSSFEMTNYFFLAPLREEIRTLRTLCLRGVIMNFSLRA
jgi:hypothetical protein